MSVSLQTSDAIEVLDDLFGDTPGYREAVAEEAERRDIARVIYEARVAAGLSQKQRADKIHSRQSVISRLEVTLAPGTRAAGADPDRNGVTVRAPSLG